MSGIYAKTSAYRPRHGGEITMAIGEGCESKPLLHKGTSERDSLLRDALQPPSFNTSHHMQENLQRFRRTREFQSLEKIHGARRERHKEKAGVRASVQGRITKN